MYNRYHKRFKEIVKVFTNYGFDFIIDLKIKKKNPSAKDLRKAFEELGPTFVKIGQILSTRSDLIPREYIDELRKLQDNVSPISFEEIDEVFRDEFGKSIDESFLKFNKSPLASASISQVHSATLIDGREVIIKVQRPHVREKMEIDIHIIKKIFKFARSRFASSPIDPYDAIDEIWEASKEELDFDIEISNIKTFSKFNKNVAFIYTPYVVEELSSSKVLTLENIKGIKIDNIKTLKEEDYDLEDIAKKLAIGFLKQVFKDGFFHGDPHPGNILIKDTKICFIDFGIMGVLSDNLKDALNDAIIALALQDINKLINVFLSIGIRKGYVDKNSLYEDMRYIFDSYLSSSISNLKISLILEDIFNLVKKHNVQLPKDLTLVMKSLVLLESTISLLAPNLKILDIAIPYVRDNSNILSKLSSNELSLKGYSFIKESLKIPSKIVDVSDAILSGRTKLQMDLKNLDKPLNSLNKMINRMVFGLVVSAMIVGSSLILNLSVGPQMYGLSLVGIIGFGLSALFGILLLISILKSGLM
ncbi:ABC1 kinase family protein [Clostridium sp.]|uniref:ABC1 kinase family protein n=1 Tax=Clostridium sp. TaxID=1506 RepID=UPI003463CC76